MTSKSFNFHQNCHFFQLLWDWVEASKKNDVSPRTQVSINWHACKRETLLSLFSLSFCSIREQKKSFLFSLSLFSFVFFSIHASHPSPWGLPTDRQLERSLNCETLFTFFIQNSHFFSYYETLSILSCYETPSLSLSVRKMFSINKLWTAVRSNADKITRFFSPSVGLSSSLICLIACQF